MGKDPDRLYVDLADRELYKKMKKEPFFHGKVNKDLFLYCMGVGFQNNDRNDQFNKKDGFFLVKDMVPADEALIYALAIHEEGTTDVLLNIKKVYQIAEEYAHAGVLIISKKIDTSSFGTYEKDAEQTAVRLLKEMKSE